MVIPEIGQQFITASGWNDSYYKSAYKEDVTLQKSPQALERNTLIIYKEGMWVCVVSHPCMGRSSRQGFRIMLFPRWKEKNRALFLMKASPAMGKGAG